jgi:hypothetical protein
MLVNLYALTKQNVEDTSSMARTRYFHLGCRQPALCTVSTPDAQRRKYVMQLWKKGLLAPRPANAADVLPALKPYGSAAHCPATHIICQIRFIAAFPPLLLFLCHNIWQLNNTARGLLCHPKRNHPVLCKGELPQKGNRGALVTVTARDSACPTSTYRNIQYIEA